ncbi:MAG: thiamine pyrophosphate-dependent dehydrogenase E1 component subunit alpha [Gaiellales bacterium]
MSEDAADTPIAELEELYRSMVRLRVVEDTAYSLFLQGHIPGTTHLYQGQEAVAVGVCSMLGDNDAVAATYRGHGWALALGMSPTALIGELCGRTIGVCGGRAGSMNIADLENRLLGSFGIVGGSIGCATGAALASQLVKDGSVAVAAFGDGAVNQAYFHECLNFAAVRALPVVYVCENNLYGEWTSMFAVTGGQDIAGRAKAYGMPGMKVDGNDVLAVRETAAEAVEHARTGKGPVLLEALTYRHKGHSRTDPGKYRPEEEVDEWLARDPLPRHAARLAEGRADAIQAEIDEEVKAAVEEALASPFPEPETLHADDPEFAWES